MENKTLNFCYCFGDSLNLHGDLGNIMAFEKTASLMGVEFNFARIDSFYDDFSFEGQDILFFSPGELKVAIKIACTLKSRRDEFIEFMNRGGIIIVIGTSVALFAKNIIRTDGKVYSGLDIADISLKERNVTYSNDEVFTANLWGEEFEIVGGQIQMVDVNIHEETPLGEVTYGYGNCHKKDEGILKDGFIFTNALGPVFVKNPWFAAKVIMKVMENKGVTDTFEMPEFAFEKQSNVRINDFIKVKIEKYDASRLEK